MIMSMHNKVISITRLFIILQLLSKHSFNISSLQLVTGQDDSNSRNLVKREGGECTGEDATDDRQSHLQAHVQNEINKMMATNKVLPDNFRVHIPPEMIESFNGANSIYLPLAESNSQTTYNYPSSGKEKMNGLPLSGRNNPVERVIEARKRIRIKAYESDVTQKEKASVSGEQPRFNFHVHDWSVIRQDIDNNDEYGENKNNEDESERREEKDKWDESTSTINHVKVLKTLNWESYDIAITACTVEDHRRLWSYIGARLPVNFSLYDCPRILRELKYHQETMMWTEKAVLEEFFFSLINLPISDTRWVMHPLVQHDNWFSEVDYCEWGGVTCGSTTIGVGEGSHENTFDVADAELITSKECKNLQMRARHKNRCDRRNNRLTDGWTCEACPPKTSITKLDLTHLAFTGVLSDNLYMLSHLHRLNMMGNFIEGSIPITYKRFKYLEFVDVSKNKLSGPLPKHLPVSITELWLEDNHFTGTLPEFISTITSLTYLDVSNNSLEGTLPSWIGNMTWLNSLYLSSNQFTGTIPEFQATMYLRHLDLSHNELEGTLPASMSASLYALEELDLSVNHLTGTIPEFSLTRHSLALNLTANEFTGTVPPALCHGRFSTIYGCDAFICKPGQFAPEGAASHFGPCVDCPDQDDKSFLGQTSCPSKSYLVGDINADGTLSQREVLHLLYTFTDGYDWGGKYTELWSDVETPSCELPGIVCENGGKVTHINLTEANMCAGWNKYNKMCIGLPSEIGLFSRLKSIDMSAGTMGPLRGTIPKEISSIQSLEYLNLKGSILHGSIDHLARLNALLTLNLHNCGMDGPLPPFGRASKLQVLNLALNNFEGSIPSSYGQISNLEELILSRNRLTGTIIDFGGLQKLDDLELYGNALRGTIPKSLGNCSGLKRLDLFSNKITGTIPSEFGLIPSLQILHFKENHLTGTLPPSLLDNLPNFSWLDVTGNNLTGRIPSSYGESKSLKDLRLGGNQLHGPIPDELCRNRNLNGASVGFRYGCDHILCPLGAISEAGYATASLGCVQCPEGQSTLYLGSDSCREFTEKDLLRMLYMILDGDRQIWNEDFRKDWSESSKELCDWHGVTCQDGEIIGLSFPNSGLQL